MDLAVYMMVATISVFWIGTAFALLWSIAAEQWRDLDLHSRIVLDTED